MKVKVEIELGLYEILDRIYLLINTLNLHIGKHPEAKKHPELEPLISSAEDSLYDLYNEVSNILYNSGKDPRFLGDEDYPDDTNPIVDGDMEAAGTSEWVEENKAILFKNQQTIDKEKLVKLFQAMADDNKKAAKSFSQTLNSTPLDALYRELASSLADLAYMVEEDRLDELYKYYGIDMEE